MKTLSIIKSKLFKGCVLATAVISGSAFADDPKTPDLSSIATSVDFTSVGIAIVAIVGTLATFYATVAGAKWVLRIIRGA